MARYNRDEAREWARENLAGVVNCTIPSFTGDLKAINEKAIRHDTRLAIEHGFAGTLGGSEVAIALPEYLDFLRIISDEAGDRLILVHHASFSTLEQNIEAVHGAETAGAELVLLSYPPNFYPETEQEIYDYTKAVCDATGLAQIMPIQLSATSDHEYYGPAIPRVFSLLRAGKHGDHQMTALRNGLIDAGLEPSMDPFREFFIGRHPARPA